MNNTLEVQQQEEKKTRKLYCIRNSKGYGRWMKGTFVDNIEDADLVVAPGGSDIDPRLYGATQTHPSAWGCSRMETDPELADLRKAIALKKKIWGTCKGLN